MITGRPFPLGVICNIYCPRRALSVPTAPSRLWHLCAMWFLDPKMEADRRKVPTCSFTSSWLTGFLVGCAAQEPCLWSGGLCIMEQSVSIVHTNTQIHTNLAHFLDRKFRPYTIMKDIALPCLRLEVKRVLFRHLRVFMLACLQH